MIFFTWRCLSKGITYLVELNNVTVAHFFKYLDLASYTLHIFLVINLVLLKNLYCHLQSQVRLQKTTYFFARQHMCSLLNLAKGPLTQILA